MADQFAGLHMAALAEASNARLTHGAGRIAGSIGPLVASYRPDTHPPHAKAVPLYAEVATLLAPAVDLIICETVASLAHARAVLAGAVAAGKPIWLAVTVDDEDGSRLRSGEPVEKVLKLQGFDAVLANCSAPEAIPAALEVFAKGDRPFGAYANGFTQITKDFLQEAPTVDALSIREDFTPDVYARHVMSWVGQGATIVGGCCEVGPAHIAAIRDALLAAGHEIS
jgi:homocysteine S-methyltransferase